MDVYFFFLNAKLLLSKYRYLKKTTCSISSLDRLNISNIPYKC